MDRSNVLRVLCALEETGIAVWLEGGWGVDALIGRMTRRHRDLDIVIDVNDLCRSRGLLESFGFEYDEARPPGLPAQLVMVSPDLGEVDVHPVFRDEVGNGWQLLSRGGTWGLYPSEGLRGVGMINGRRVRCTTPELQVRHRLGYRLRPEDVHDLRLLREEFGVPIHPSHEEAFCSF